MNLSLCCILQTRAISFLLGPNILLSTLFSNTVYFLTLVWETKFRTHTQQQVVHKCLESSWEGKRFWTESQN
jgi:hypothetical protein